MKKYSFLKILGITFLIVVALSWIIPVGSYYDGTFTLGKTDPLGLLDLIRLPLSTFANFIHYGITILIIGGLYGVLIKTGAYDNLVEKIVEKFKGKEKTFLIITVLFFSILTSLTGLVYLLLVLVPFFMAILLLMNYNKLTTLMATVGAMFVGLIGCTYGFNINGIINYYFALKNHDEIITKFIFLALITFLLVVFVVKTSKRVDTEKEKINIPLFKKDKKNQKSYWPLAIVMITTLIILLIGMYNWIYSFNVTFFSEMHNSLMDLKVADYPIVKNIIGSVNAMGYWNIYELAVILIAAMLLIGWIYSLKSKDLVDSFISGAKEILPTSLYLTLANIIFTIIISGYNDQNMFYSIANYFFNLTEKLNVVTMSLVSSIGSFFYNDFSSYLEAMGTNIAIIYPDAEFYQIIGLISRTMYGLVMFIAPTSLLLVGGLTYLNISYKEWLKYIWKYLIQVLVIALLVMVIMLIFI